MSRSRELQQAVRGQPTQDGAGVKLTRILTGQWQQRLDPFLMLDEFRSDKADDYIAGFPAHPHRGFETVTYMLAGKMRHQDSVGNEGVIGPGDVQWMTAARGIIHAEMPEQERGLMHGFQLWVNLRSDKKMQPAGYRELVAEQIPVIDLENSVQLKLIAGRFMQHEGAVQRPDTEPHLMDLHLPASERIELPLPVTHHAFVYPFVGDIEVGSSARRLPLQTMGILETHSDADMVRLKAVSDARILIVSGKPLREPIVQHGPFVMNSVEQIYQAISDYQQGRFATPQ